MIETRDLVKSVDTSEGVLTILKGISLKFEAGEAVASGTYFYQLQAGDYIETKKMVILK